MDQGDFQLAGHENRNSKEQAQSGYFGDEGGKTEGKKGKSPGKTRREWGKLEAILFIFLRQMNF